jgi:ABC-type multidrug transport system fused ATPase/permease subunit
MKAIKLYAWEEPYRERLAEARAEERRAIRKTQLMACVNTIMFSGGPILVAIAAFGTYSALGHPLTADVAFPALAYFDLLRFPIIMLPMQVMNFINARVALRRLQEFVDADEVEQPRFGALPQNACFACVHAATPAMPARACCACAWVVLCCTDSLCGFGGFELVSM